MDEVAIVEGFNLHITTEVRRSRDGAGDDSIEAEGSDIQFWVTDRVCRHICNTLCNSELYIVCVYAWILESDCLWDTLCVICHSILDSEVVAVINNNVSE